MTKKTNSALNFAAFLSIIVASLVFLVSWVLGKLSLDIALLNTLLPLLEKAAVAVIFVIGTILGWRYVINRNVALRILYLVCFLVLIVCFVLPLLGI